MCLIIKILVSILFRYCSSVKFPTICLLYFIPGLNALARMTWFPILLYTIVHTYLYVHNCSNFLEHIDDCAKLLTHISTLNDRAERIRIVLKVAATSHISVRRWEKLTVDLSSPTVEDLGGALLYLFEGIIPLITAFCMEFYKLSCFGPASKTFKRLLKSEDIAKSLSCFARSVGVCFLPWVGFVKFIFCYNAYLLAMLSGAIFASL